MDVDLAEKTVEEYLLKKEKLKIKEVHATAAKFISVGSDWRYVVSGWVKHKDGTVADFECSLDENWRTAGWQLTPRKKA